MSLDKISSSEEGEKSFFNLDDQVQNLKDSKSKKKSYLIWSGVLVLGLLMITVLSVSQKYSFENELKSTNNGLKGIVKLDTPILQEQSGVVNIEIQEEYVDSEAARKEVLVSEIIQPVDKCISKGLEFLNIKWCEDKPNNLVIGSDGSPFLVIVQGNGEGAGMKRFEEKKEAFEVVVPIYTIDKISFNGGKLEVRLECEEGKECSVIGL